MPQVTLYMPESLLERLRARALRSGRSLSSYVVDLLETRRGEPGWPKGFASLYGSWEGRFPVPEDPSPDDLDELK